MNPFGRPPIRAGVVVLLAACGLSLSGCGSSGDGVEAGQGSGPVQFAESGWVGSWSTAPYGPYPLGPLDAVYAVLPLPEVLRGFTTPTAFPDLQAVDQSFRMIVHPTLGGEQLRLRFSNLVGDRPVTLEPVRVAIRALAAAIIPGTNTPVLFDGESTITMMPGEEYVSDPVDLVFAEGDDLVVSFHLPGESGPLTWHAMSFDTQFLTPQGAGDVTDSETGAEFSEITLGWFFLSGVDVQRSDALGAVVALGDSITDGMMQTPGTNTRWPDLFANRLQAAGIPMGVLNLGINGNTVFARPEQTYRGAPAIERFNRDVLERAGARSLVLFEGSNDLATGATAEEIHGHLMALVERAHAAGLCVVLGTIMPRDDLVFGWDRASMEPERQALNEMIRADFAAGLFEGLADFAAVMGAPFDATRPNPALYFADLLHPNSIGFHVLADTVPIEPLVPPPYGSCSNERQI